MYLQCEKETALIKMNFKEKRENHLNMCQENQLSTDLESSNSDINLTDQLLSSQHDKTPSSTCSSIPRKKVWIQFSG